MGPRVVIEQLLRLDSFVSPGLSATEFATLLTKCTCGLIMTHRAFEYHVCAATAHIPTAARGVLRLDSLISPGVSDAEFAAMFTKCACGLIMTRRAFKGHVCTAMASHIPSAPVVIDLTLDSSGSQADVIDLTMDSDNSQ
jgi:hypothetical protein